RQMTKNMPQILMFVYALIILLSLILVATYNIDVPCKTDEDCPEASPPRIKQDQNFQNHPKTRPMADVNNNNNVENVAENQVLLGTTHLQDDPNYE
ncbi:CCP protein, partial [Trifolium pratense]